MKELYNSTSGDCFISSELAELQRIASEEVIRRHEICSYPFRVEAECETSHSPYASGFLTWWALTRPSREHQSRCWIKFF